MYLIRSNSSAPFSWVIRKRTGSRHSHYAIILSSTLHKDALIIESAISRKGVQFTTLKSFCKRASDWEITELQEKTTQAQLQKALDISCEYEGTKYDLAGAIGLGVDEDWQDPIKWWCTELVGIILKRLGLMPWFDWDRLHRLDTLDCEKWPQTVVLTSKEYSWE